MAMSDGGGTPFVLRVEKGPRAGEDVAIPDERFTIGRRPNNNLPIKEIQVSGVHAEIVIEDGRAVLRDLGSTNGTFLEGKKVDEVVLDHGERLKIGSLEAVFVDTTQGTVPAAKSATPSFDLEDDEAGDGEESLGGGTLSAPPPAKGRKLLATVSLLAFVLVLGGGAVLFFMNPWASEEGSESLPADPANIVGSTWSFEDQVDDRLETRLSGLTAFRNVRTAAKSGKRGLSAKLEDGQRAAARVQALEVRGGRRYDLSVSAAGSGGATAVLGVRVHSDPAAGEAMPSNRLEASAVDAGFRTLKGSFTVPESASAIDVVLAGIGPGTVKFDDLIVKEAGAADDKAQRLGAYEVRIRAPMIELTQSGGGSIGVGWMRLHRQEEIHEEAEAEGSPTVQRVDLPACLLDVKPDIQMADTSLIGKYEVRGGTSGDTVEMVVRWRPNDADPGVRALSSRGVEAFDGSFEAAEVTSLLLGAASGLAQIAFDAPITLRGEAHSEGMDIVIDQSGSSSTLGFSVRAEFREESIEAGRLVKEAESLLNRGDAGQAYAKAKQVLSTLPFDEGERARASEIASRILQQGRETEQDLQKLISEASFLKSPDKLAQAERDAREAVARFEGTPMEDAFRTLSSQADESYGVYTSEIAGMTAERLYLMGERLARLPNRKGTAELILSYVGTHFPETEWAGKARELLR